jgi:cytidylate kinase
MNMKKIMIVGAVILVAVVTLAIGGFAYAQTQTPPVPEVPFGQGMMGGQNGHMSGMMGGRGSGWMHGRGGDGQLRAYMEAALAEAFGLSADEFQAAQQAGKNLRDIAKEQGLTVAEFQAKVDQARQSALEQAVADGVITQEQADQMKSLKEQAKGRKDKMGAMHETMQAAVAAEFGLTVEELEARKDAGETMMDLAAEQGLTVEEFEARLTAAHTKALAQAVADGVITQEQADWMQQHMGSQGMMGGFGKGGCMGGGMRGSGKGSGMHRFSPPAGPTN